jgi:hypothetical protein
MVSFEAEVRCQGGNGAINLWLQGQVRVDGRISDMNVFFSGATAALPQSMHDVRISELATAQMPRRYRIESREVNVELQARSMQTHRAAAAALFAAVPPARVPWRLRAGWALLLALLRLPGVGSLILGRGGAA